MRRQNALRSRPLFTAGREFNHPRLIFNGPTRVFSSQIDGPLVNAFSNEQEFMNALQDPYHVSFVRRTVDSYIPFMLDRVTASTRLLNPRSVNYVGMLIATYLSNVCQQKPEPTPPQIEPAILTENVIPPQQEVDRPNNEDEARSVDEVSVDSTELTNRFENMNQVLEDEETAQDELNDGEQTPRVLDEEPQMEVEQPAAEQPETETPAEQSTEAANDNLPAEENDQPGPSGLQQAEESDPDGIDPAFLAALPEDIRQEVILDHQRQQRLNQLQRRQRQQSTSAVVLEGENPTANVEENAPAAENPPQAEEDILDQEFLAALPPELQEEVLAQHEQRLAQQAARNAAANQNAGDAPGADAIAFLDSLNPTLRAQVLADADESVINILPENLAAVSPL